MNSPTIYKYPLEIGENRVHLSRPATPLSVDYQPGHGLMLWALVDADSDWAPDEHVFTVYPTGGRMPADPGRFIGTVLQADGQLVWHVFWETADMFKPEATQFAVDIRDHACGQNSFKAGHSHDADGRCLI